MPYNFGLLNFQGFLKAPQWLKGQVGRYESGKPPVDNACDNNYQTWGDNVAGTGAIPAFKFVNSANQFEINAGHAVIDNALSIVPLAVPATPTAVVNGTAGSTSRAYRVVGRAGSLQAPSGAVTVATGNATLSSVNSITLTFVPTPGFLVYDVYRTAASGTPSTTGRIGIVVAAFTNNISSPTLTFTDTGLTADGSTVPSVNTTGAITGDVSSYGNLTVAALATPATPLVQPQGTTGASTVAYKIVARSGGAVAAGGHTAASSAGSTTTANATLSATNYNLISWQPVPGAAIYDVYRTTAGGTSPTTTGLIGSTTSSTFSDTGLAGDSSSAPTTNTTGVITGGSVSTSGSSTQTVASNYIATETGANNAIVGALPGGITAVAGTEVIVKLAHSLQAGANTFNTVAIKSHFNPATDIGTAYVSGGFVKLLFSGTAWLDMSQ